MKRASRQYSAYEINHLLKHKLDLDLLQRYPDKPVEYISGHAEFMERDFLVNENVLIPRIETEKLVEIVCNYISSHYQPEQEISLVDIGTGSGAIGLSIFLELHGDFPKLQVLLSDISPKALKIARANKKALIPKEYQAQITLLQSDLLLDFPDGKKIDIIVANLPYIPSQRLEQLPDSVVKFEPHLALFGGADKGLELVNKLVAQAENLVFRPNCIFQEIDEFVEVKDLYRSGNYKSEILTDQFQKNRFAQFLLVK